MRDDWKLWKRATNASRKEVAKEMKALGYRTEVWTKRDKGRTIVQVFGKDAELGSVLMKAVEKVNAKYADRLILEIPAYGENPARPKQYRIMLSKPEKYHGGEIGYTLLVS